MKNNKKNAVDNETVRLVFLNLFIINSRHNKSEYQVNTDTLPIYKM